MTAPRAETNTGITFRILLGVNAGRKLRGLRRSKLRGLAGVEVTGDPGSSFLLSDDDSAVCVFTLPDLADLGDDIADHAGISLVPVTEPSFDSGMAIKGQRVTFTFEDSE